MIRKINISDAAFFLELANSDGWLKYIGQRNINNLEAAERYIKQSFVRTHEQIGFGYSLVANTLGEKLGMAGFLNKSYLDNPDFGFAFLPQYQGQGLAFESCQLILQQGIAANQFSQVDAVTMPSNQPAIALLGKLGFIYIEDILEPENDQPLRLYQYQA